MEIIWALLFVGSITTIEILTDPALLEPPPPLRLAQPAVTDPNILPNAYLYEEYGKPNGLTEEDWRILDKQMGGNWRRVNGVQF